MSEDIHALQGGIKSKGGEIMSETTARNRERILNEIAAAVEKEVTFYIDRYGADDRDKLIDIATNVGLEIVLMKVRGFITDVNPERDIYGE